MKINIRQENTSDYKTVFKVIEGAFKNEPLSDLKEQILVDKLRKSSAFIPELSLVAEFNDEIVGHILLTKIKIINNNRSLDSLALAPVSVKPEFQNRGFGGKLILESHKIARELGFQSIVLLGHENYYPKFGYELASKYNIKIPFDAPDENCMIIELTENGLKGVSGTVQYSREFYE